MHHNIEILYRESDIYFFVYEGYALTSNRSKSLLKIQSKKMYILCYFLLVRNYFLL